MIRSSLLVAGSVLLASTSAIGQVTIVWPTPVTTVFNQAIPFGAVRNHHQFWFSAAQVAAQIGGATRFTEMAFWTPFGGQSGRSQQFEIRLASGPATAASATFANNLVSGETLVFSSRAPNPVFQTPTTVMDTFSFAIPFSTPFEWDGQSGLTVDVKLYDNGNMNTPFAYAIGEEPNGFGRGSTMWTLNDPDAGMAVNFLNRTPIVQFTADNGITVPFGSGCRGSGNVSPSATTSGGRPILGNPLWTQQLNSAAPMAPTIWMIGLSNTNYLGLPLPHELVEVQAFGCDLLVAPDLTASLFTAAGGPPGSGTASLRTRVPFVGGLDGMTWYSQWLILDAGASNGVLAATGGLAHTFSQ